MNMNSFAWVLGGSAVLSLLIMLLSRNRFRLRTGTVLLFWIVAVPLCVLAGRGAYWLCSLDWIRDSGYAFWDLLGSGYSYMLYGAVLGGAAAAWIASKVTGQSFAGITDAAAIPAALTAAAGRFGEYLLDAGFGSGVVEWFDPYESWSMIAWEEPDAICRFPFAVQNYYGTWRFSINLWEGVAALIFAILLIRKKTRREGSSASLLLLLYAGCQILFESMRKDEVIIWGFVKANQLISGILVILLLVLFHMKQPAETRKPGELAKRLGTVLVLLGIVLLMEFTLDQKIGFLLWMRADVSYAVMAMCCLGMILTVIPAWRKAGNGGETQSENNRT